MNDKLIGRFVLCPFCKCEDVEIVRDPGGAGPVLKNHRSGIVCCANVTAGEPDARTLLLCKVKCPASGQPVTRMCDGEHAAPVCGDPQCYHTEDPEDGAFFACSDCGENGTGYHVCPRSTES